ncbi:MAG TPA: HEPN domain-containing protein [Anaerolineales bacterium]|nr:HEPN domain-containing protein [Anaerolineales bacterium]
MCEARKILQERPCPVSSRFGTGGIAGCSLTERKWWESSKHRKPCLLLVFYAALALLVTVDVEPNKHAGVLAKFDELFIRQGIFPKEMSRIIHHAFDMRQAGDYQKSKVITEEQAVDVLTSAEVFVRTIREKLL